MRDDAPLAVAVESRPFAVFPVAIEFDTGDALYRAELVDGVGRFEGSEGVTHHSLRVGVEHAPMSRSINVRLGGLAGKFLDALEGVGRGSFAKVMLFAKLTLKRAVGLALPTRLGLFSYFCSLKLPRDYKISL